MADWGLPGAAQGFTEEADFFNSVTTGSASTFGAWVSLGTPTRTMNGLLIAAPYAGTGATRNREINLGVGSTKEIVIPGLQLPQPTNETYIAKQMCVVDVPIILPAGQEIWVQSRCSLATQIYPIRVIPKQIDPGLLGCRVDALLWSTITMTGATTYANSGVVAAAAKRYKALFFVLKGNAANTELYGLLNWRMRRGAVGNETVVMSGIQMFEQHICQSAVGNPYISPPVLGPFYVDIPVGERFYFQWASTVGAETISFYCYGVY